MSDDLNPILAISKKELRALYVCFQQLQPLFNAAMKDDVETGVCALESCNAPFVKRESKQRFCCPEHQMKYSNNHRKERKREIDFAGSAPVVEQLKCQVQDCTNTFMLDTSLPFPYRCRECASKSV
jgi:hypothetical protein